MLTYIIEKFMMSHMLFSIDKNKNGSPWRTNVLVVLWRRKSIRWVVNNNLQLSLKSITCFYFVHTGKHPPQLHEWPEYLPGKLRCNYSRWQSTHITLKSTIFGVYNMCCDTINARGIYRVLKSSIYPTGGLKPFYVLFSPCQALIVNCTRLQSILVKKWGTRAHYNTTQAQACSHICKLWCTID